MCQKSNMTQETFVSRVTFVNNKTMQTTFAKLKLCCYWLYFTCSKVHI